MPELVHLSSVSENGEECATVNVCGTSLVERHFCAHTYAMWILPNNKYQIILVIFAERTLISRYIYVNNLEIPVNIFN